MPATPESSAPVTLLAFDVGSRRVGVAVGNRLTANARALTTLGKGDWGALDRVVAQWAPQRFVVGLPLALDGSEQAMTQVARQFASELERRYAHRADLVDERYTSQEAARRFAQRRGQGAAKRKDAADLDSLAAEVILEAWFADGGGIGG